MWNKNYIPIPNKKVTQETNKTIWHEIFTSSDSRFFSILSNLFGRGHMCVRNKLFFVVLKVFGFNLPKLMA
jgi:hypothetical protein